MDDPLTLRENLMRNSNLNRLKIVEILNNDPVMENGDIEWDDDDEMIGFHTSLPIREDEWELYDLYEKRMIDLGYKNLNEGGLSDESIIRIKNLGYEIQMNDCEGLENEGMIVKI